MREFLRAFESHQIVTFQARLYVVKRKFGNGANEFPREDFSILFNNGKCATCNNAKRPTLLAKTIVLFVVFRKVNPEKYLE